MKKYLEIIRINWNQILIYRFDVFSGSVLSIIRLVLAYLLWKAIYTVESNISGYTFNAMMTYYIFTTFFMSLDKSSAMAGQLSEEIRGGGFTKYLVKPIKLLPYFCSSTLSQTSYVAVINIFGAGIWILLFQKYFVLNTNIKAWIAMACLVLLGLVFLTLFNYFLSIFTFWFVDVSSLFLFKDNIIEFLTGSLVPLNLLPVGIVSALKFLPFYYISYYPVSIYLYNDFNQIGFAITVLCIWILLFIVIDIILYNKAKKSYSGVGI